MKTTTDLKYNFIYTHKWHPSCLSGKESTCKAEDTGDAGSIPGLGRCLGGGHGNTLQYSCLKNHMDREAWRASFHEVPRVGLDPRNFALTHVTER